jgi:hypothetical protein
VTIVGPVICNPVGKEFHAYTWSHVWVSKDGTSIFHTSVDGMNWQVLPDSFRQNGNALFRFASGKVVSK